MNLIVDIGNTMVKLAVVHDGSIVAERTSEEFSDETVNALLSEYPVGRAIVSSTRDDAQAVARRVRERVGYCLAFLPQTPVPIGNAYETPETLGRDRLAAAVGAAVRYPGRNLLIVDFGTALTIDLVTDDNTFRGGFISPGVRSRFRALHDYTARLPLCEPADEELPLGVTTRTAVEQGVMQGIVGEIEGHITRIGERHDELCVIFTGGDAKYFAKRIKNTIFANWNPVVCGLDRILEYNASEENPD